MSEGEHRQNGSDELLPIPRWRQIKMIIKKLVANVASTYAKM